MAVIQLMKQNATLICQIRDLKIDFQKTNLMSLDSMYSNTVLCAVFYKEC